MIVVTEGVLPADEIIRSVETGNAGTAGAVVSFFGVVRNHSAGHSVEYLEYEAYQPMAELELSKVAQEVAERWSRATCSIGHRLGRLGIGEASLVVAVAAPHRKEAFAACQHVVDRIKETVPIWKKEVGTDGQRWVEDPLSQRGNGSLATPLPL